MKKMFFCLMVGALFFSACSDSEKYQYRDMKDTENKSVDYYEGNLEEAFEKAKWCFAKNMPETPEFEVINATNRYNCMYAEEALGLYLDKEELKKNREKYKLYEQYLDFKKYKVKQKRANK